MPEKSSEIIRNSIKNNQLTLGNVEADEVVSKFGINTPRTLGVKSISEAIKFAKEYGYPVVLKISSPGLLHKKNVGGVILGIRDQKQLKDSWNILEKRKKDLEKSITGSISFQIQKEVSGGVEMIVGVRKDKTFGHVLLFGAGGSLAELILDKNISLFPIDINRAKDLIEGSKIFKSLEKMKKDDEKPLVLDKLYELLVKVSKIVEAQPEIEEIEINPVIVNSDDIWAVDTKVILNEKKDISPGPKFKTAKTISTKNLAGKVYYFEFESEEPLDVIPGQYINVKVSDTRVNCYSIAGHRKPNAFNLLVDTTPGGPGSKFFESLKMGDKIDFLGPFGSFTLKQNDNVKDMLFLATGCGFAPLKYMIESILEKDDKKKNIRLYFGFNNYEDIFLKEYFEELAKIHKNFKYQIAVNNPSTFWKGPNGFITDLVKKDYPNTSNCSAYLCGNKFMVEDLTKLLIENGTPSERIYMEKYGKF